MPPDLPYDIISQIAQKLQLYDPNSVLSLCLVSQAFLIPCQQQIFQKIDSIAGSIRRPILPPLPPRTTEGSSGPFNPPVRGLSPAIGGQGPAAASLVEPGPGAIPAKFLKLKETFERSPHLTKYVRTLNLVNLKKVETGGSVGMRLVSMRPVTPYQSDWVLHNPAFFARILELLKDSPITTIVIQGEIIGIGFHWDWFPANIKSALQAIFARGTVETLILQNLVLPGTFFGWFGRDVVEERYVNVGDGVLKEIKLLRTALKMVESQGAGGGNEDGDPFVSYRLQRPRRLQIATRAARPDSQGTQDIDFRRIGPRSWLDLSNVGVLKLMLASVDVQLNHLFAAMGKSLRELHVGIYRAGVPSTPLDLSPLKELEKLAIIDTPSPILSSNSVLEIPWFINCLSSLSKPHYNIQDIKVEFHTMKSEDLVTSSSTCQAFSNTFSAIHESSPRLKNITIGLLVSIRAQAEIQAKMEEEKRRRDILAEKVQWVGCDKVLKVDVRSISAFPRMPWAAYA